MIRKTPTIGKCKNYSIPKSALIWWFEKNKDGYGSIDYGMLDTMHEIVHIAGGKQIGMWTPSAVTSRLRNSVFWTSETIRGMYSGIGNGKASLFTPSSKGKAYYKNFLSNPIQEKLQKLFKIKENESVDECLSHPHVGFIFGNKELHAYCCNHSEHIADDYKSHDTENGNAFGISTGSNQKKAISTLLDEGWVFDIKKDICLCPKCINSIIAKGCNDE